MGRILLDSNLQGPGSFTLTRILIYEYSSQYLNLKLVTRDRDTSRHMSTLHPSDTFMTTNTWQQTCYHFGKIME